jgi:hypothetical protein
MRWFRDNIRLGSWGALFGLAINLALSFGHAHAIDGNSHDAGVLITALAHPGADQKQSQQHDGHPDDLCPICVATAALASAMAPPPPVVPVNYFAAATIDHAIEQTVAVVEPQRVAFKPRGPPIS